MNKYIILLLLSVAGFSKNLTCMDFAVSEYRAPATAISTPKTFDDWMEQYKKTREIHFLIYSAGAVWAMNTNVPTDRAQTALQRFISDSGINATEYPNAISLVSHLQQERTRGKKYFYNGTAHTTPMEQPHAQN